MISGRVPRITAIVMYDLASTCIRRVIIRSGWFTGRKPQSRRARGGRTNGDDYRSEANILFSSVGIR